MNENLAQMIWNKAWEDDHAYGYHDVELCYEELSDFVREIIEKIN